MGGLLYDPAIPDEGPATLRALAAHRIVFVSGDLRGPDGNALALLGRLAATVRAAGLDPEAITRVLTPWALARTYPEILDQVRALVDWVDDAYLDLPGYTVAPHTSDPARLADAARRARARAERALRMNLDPDLVAGLLRCAQRLDARRPTSARDERLVYQ